jgi:Ni/Fe-hydrogenase subunit HybB-like protein
LVEQKRNFPIGITVLTFLVILGLIPMVMRYVEGLGATTNLSDGRPWGFWISFDLYCGVALAAGGFTAWPKSLFLSLHWKARLRYRTRSQMVR